MFDIMNRRLLFAIVCTALASTLLLPSCTRISPLPSGQPLPLSTPSAITEQPAILLITPRGGESWSVGSAYTINWTYKGDPGANVIIYLYKANTLSTISYAPIGTDGSGSYTWNISATITTGTDYKVRVSSELNPFIYGESIM